LKGSNFFIYPFRFKFLSIKETTISEKLVLFSVSKRNFKKATTRNLVKRRMREGYRLNQTMLHTNETLHLAMIYSAKEVHDFRFIEEKLILGLKRLSEKLSPTSAS
jgi:ribonuclease P protein component